MCIVQAFEGLTLHRWNRVSTKCTAPYSLRHARFQIVAIRQHHFSIGDFVYPDKYQGGEGSEIEIGLIVELTTADVIPRLP